MMYEYTDKQFRERAKDFSLGVFIDDYEKNGTYTVIANGEPRYFGSEEVEL